MAHELQEVLPQAVSGNKDAEEMQSVDYSKIVPLLVKSIQELKAEVDKLKKECKCK
jgi:glycerol-3-phosphate responsive antiterminator